MFQYLKKVNLDNMTPVQGKNEKDSHIYSRWGTHLKNQFINMTLDDPYPIRMELLSRACLRWNRSSSLDHLLNLSDSFCLNIKTQVIYSVADPFHFDTDQDPDRGSVSWITKISVLLTFFHALNGSAKLQAKDINHPLHVKVNVHINNRVVNFYNKKEMLLPTSVPVLRDRSARPSPVPAPASPSSPSPALLSKRRAPPSEAVDVFLTWTLP